MIWALLLFIILTVLFLDTQIMWRRPLISEEVKTLDGQIVSKDLVEDKTDLRKYFISIHTTEGVKNFEALEYHFNAFTELEQVTVILKRKTVMYRSLLRNKVSTTESLIDLRF